MSTPVKNSTFPNSFRLFNLMASNNIRGAYILWRFAMKRGWWNVDVRVPVNGHTFDYNLAYRNWSSDVVEDYEHKVVRALRDVSKFATTERFTLVDCGADLGLMTLKIFASGFTIDRVYAFEPNGEKLPYLRRNVSRLPGETHILDFAVGESTGQGALRQPQHDRSDEAAFIQSDSSGAIAIRTLDETIDSADNLILKLDIEGGELDALRGARELIKNAEKVVVLIEAHSQVAERTGIDPSEILRFLKSCKAELTQFIAEVPEKELTDAPFFSQVPPGIYNLCVHNCS